MYDLDDFMGKLKSRNIGQPEFIQAVGEVLETILPAVNGNPIYQKNMILERLTEPDRIIQFRIEWEDDEENLRVNRGWRIQFNNVLGPYKGGLRFHPSVTLGTLKFLGFEQVFKNALTGLPIGGAKGGSDFNPKGKSDREILRFCRAFMRELYKYIGPNTDVPAGDLGVGGREIGYLYGEYRRLRDETTGVLTGKGEGWGGSKFRPEATGFGTMYFAQEMLQKNNESIEGKRIAISGFGNVAWGAVMKASQLGAKVVTISGPDGYIIDEDSINCKEKWDYMLYLRATNNDIVAPYATKFGAQFIKGKKPWEVPVDMAFCCAIQNELDAPDIENLLHNGCRYIIETSNMGLTAAAIKLLHAYRDKVTWAPGKAANAGGVATSCLEMSQNAQHYYWSGEEVDAKLHRIMTNIHTECVAAGIESDGHVDYQRGANIAGFRKVADAMVAQAF